MQLMNHSRSALNGLVLAGGKSTRMGEDKGILQWYGKEQRYYVADMLATFCEEVFISCRSEQTNAIDKNYKVIEDEFEDTGPLGAIVSALHHVNNCAWLVIACDLPLLNEKTIHYLIQNREENVIATTFSTDDGLPEPLITIWEPAALPLLEAALSEGKYSPQKVLMKAKIKIIQTPDPNTLLNVNTPAEKEKVMALLK
jgi:molybdopterin-guanine dinucleotide biosynthesis protein A